jgi:hypothetical protein
VRAVASSYTEGPNTRIGWLGRLDSTRGGSFGPSVYDDCTHSSRHVRAVHRPVAGTDFGPDVVSGGSKNEPMSTTTEAVTGGRVLPDDARGVLAAARGLRALADQAEVRLLELAVQWAIIHPAKWRP